MTQAPGDQHEELFVPGEIPTQIRERIQRHAGRTWEELEEGMRKLGVGRLRLIGVYDDRQEAHFMLRTRITGGLLRADQAECLAQISRDFGVKPEGEVGPSHRTIEITTRQNLQTHWLRFEHLPEIWDRYDAVGLTSVMACGDSLRNITGCPVAGVDRRELFPARPVLDAIQAYAMAETETTSRLPRKFKIAVTTCPSDCIVSKLHCLAFTPARAQTGELGFHCHIGGGLSDYPRLASELSFFVLPNQVVDVVRAVIALYREEGTYETKAVNRFRMLVHQMGPGAAEEGIRKRLSFSPLPAGEDLMEWREEDHLGVHGQSDGTEYVGACVPVGRITADELSELARLARTYGDGNLRLTQRQNVVLSGIRNANVFLAEGLLQRFSPFPDPFERGIVACTSAPFCKFGILSMKDMGRELRDHLRAEIPEGSWPALQGVRLHLSGCKASCAQVQYADVGLRATMGKTEESYRPAVDVALGGAPQTLASWATLETSVETAFDGIANLLQDLAAHPERRGSVSVATAGRYFEGDEGP